MKKFNKVFEAYWWVKSHPKLKYKHRPPWIEVTPHLIDPSIGGINTTDFSKNTVVEYWVEAGPYVLCDHFGDGSLVDVTPSHDWELDCGGFTYEEAIYNLANLVLEKYGDYED